VLHYKHDAAHNICQQNSKASHTGFTQAEGINYNETFSPMEKLSAIHIIAAIAAHNGWELEQMDIDGAYSMPPKGGHLYALAEGYKVPGREHLICKLEWALYGLKQAGRSGTTTS